MAKLAGTLLLLSLAVYGPCLSSQVKDGPAPVGNQPTQSALSPSILPNSLMANAVSVNSSTETQIADRLMPARVEPATAFSSSMRYRVQQFAPPQAPPVRIFDHKFKTLAALAIVTTAADLELTARCRHCREANPLYGSNPSRVRLYGIGAPLLFGEIMVSRTLRKRSPGGKLWMMPTLSVSAAHMAGVATNLHAR